MFLGKVFNQRENHCRILVLCEVQFEGNKISYTNIGNEKVEDIVGPTKAVFVHNNSSLNLYDDEYVLFSIKKNTIIKEGGDTFIIDKLYKEHRAYPLLTSHMNNIDEIFKHKFYKNNISTTSTCYIIQKDKIIGPVKFNPESNTIKTLSPGATYTHSWDIKLFNIIEIDDCNSFMIGKPEEKGSEIVDISTTEQLNKWFKKQIKEYSNEDLFNDIKKIEPLFEHIKSTELSEHEQLKWIKIKQNFEKINLEYEDINKILLFPSIYTKIKSTLESYKHEYQKSKKQELLEVVTNELLENYKELSDIEEELKVKKQNVDNELKSYRSQKEMELQQITTKIANKEQDLQTLSLLADNEKKSVGILKPLLKNYDENKEELIQQATILQSIISGNEKRRNIININDKFNVGIQNIVDNDFYISVSQKLLENGSTLSPSKVRLMKIALDTCKGLFVPEDYWSRFYCDAHPNFHHFAITIDPSIKNIKDLWELYLEDIALTAIENPLQKFYIHFDGINNSVADVWMKPLKNLIQYENVTVPVKGLPTWPENIYFFFTPAYHKNAFILTDTTFQYFPSIHSKELDEINDSTNQSDKNNINRIALAIEEVTKREPDECELQAKELVYGYAQHYLNNEA